jgi:hypothetical protein
MAVIDGQLATEAVIAGFTASCYAASPTSGGGVATGGPRSGESGGVGYRSSVSDNASPA